ncbi:MAG: Rpn family recombination-promoting nuclease/putative transposase, partial [Spirochaetia bacterium]
MKKDRFIHKHGYGVLFSDKTLIKELLESFVDKEFASEIDFSDFKPLVEKSYISDEFKDFAEDLLVKVRLKGKEAYIYLFIEFQST